MALFGRQTTAEQHPTTPSGRSARFMQRLGALTGIGREQKSKNVPEVSLAPEVPVSPETLGKLEEVCNGVWSTVQGSTPADKLPPGLTVRRGLLRSEDREAVGRRALQSVRSEDREAVHISQPGDTKYGWHEDISLYRDMSNGGAETWVIRQQTRKLGAKTDPILSLHRNTYTYTVDTDTPTTQRLEVMVPTYTKSENGEKMINGETVGSQELVVGRPLSESQALAFVQSLSALVSPDVQAA